MPLSDLSLFPLKRPDLFKLYEKLLASFWTPHEIDMKAERTDYLKMNEGQQHFLSHILAFFASSDFLVIDNLIQNFLAEFEDPSARLFLAVQCASEAVHVHTYSLLLDTTIPDKAERERLVNGYEGIPAITAKCAWVRKYFDKRRPFAARLIAFLCVEGIFFSGSFAAVFYVGTLGLCPGLCAANRFISRDEAAHAEFAVAVYNTLQYKLDRAALMEVIDEAVTLEIEFVTQSLPCRLLGMNSDMMSQHIRSVADFWLHELGEPPFYNVKTPFLFMEKLSLIPQGNFFEVVESEYALSVNRGEFGTEEDF